MAQATRVMSEAEKAERSRKARLKFLPTRNTRQMLFDLMVEALKSKGNTLSHDEMNLAVTEAAKLQVTWKLGENGNVLVKDKEGNTRMEYKSLTWAKLAIDQQADLMRAIRQGTSMKFSYLKDGDEPTVEVVEDEADAAEAA